MTRRPPDGAARGRPTAAARRAATRARAGHRDLLADDRAHGELGAVDRPRHAPAGRPAHERGEQAGTPEDGVDGLGVGVQVEQRPAALHGGREVAQVAELESALDATVARGELGDAVAVGEAQRAPVGVAGDLFDSGHRASREEPKQGGAIERCAARQSQEQRAGFRGGGGRGGAGTPAPPRPPPHLGGRQGEHRPHGVVELTQAGEAGGEGDVVERYGGRFDQQSRRLGTPGSREVEGPRSELLGEQSAQVARAVGESPREAVDAFAVDEPSAMRRIARPARSARRFHCGERPAPRRDGSAGRP